MRLGELAREAGLAPPAPLVDALRRLGRHYIAARYPDAHAAGPLGPHYGESDATQAIADAEAVLAFVDATWKGLSG